ncbi:sensor histidine kinase RegB [Lentibacter sp. XHP0401]|jgi:two-component system, sensor histidine kinase RegB|uniref:sensor histidine kinase RegB n=1 Tax=Lentibacter sp. XHP0401 TaxID=2984334 RepID=UPI0021E988DF|nr:ActS/PrrB/RegB family redox-sensitive histidine kinase [Lentibacter sp. XHP0401]MCV2892644.1 ActS/PrrB/RegB family redox-sensitive histidine kinase [Lentibacter sp. XHP0401]
MQSDNTSQLTAYPPLPEGLRRSNYIRLRTFIWLRWAAVFGQLTALFVAERYYNLQFEVGLFYLVVGASVLANLVAMFIFPLSRRLSERENFFMVLFDLLQLGVLLFLSGGLNNPFSVLIVGPVAVSAAVFSTRSTIILGLITLVIVSGLTQFYFPLRTEQGFIIRIPDIFMFGTWAAVVIAVVFLGVYVRRIALDANAMSEAFQAAQLALSREQKLTDLGGVVAAAAHELGTPLATIKLVSSELLDEFPEGSELREDIELIAQQADRCRDILRSMGRTGKDDIYMRQAPVATVVQDAASPHTDRGKAIHFSEESVDGTPQPEIYRKPEIIHGLRNLVQNAVDFSRANVWVETVWSSENVTVRIQDDGGGYPPGLIGRIGDPFMRRRSNAQTRAKQTAYEGMGLGLFIAKTLLERSGAELNFTNGPDAADTTGTGPHRSGALVVVRWNAADVQVDTSAGRTPLGQNKPITT